jgi:hypothetical protein
MSRTPDVELVLRDYFADDGLSAPDYVLDVVEERIGRQPRRRAWRLPWRLRPMNRTLKYVAALAAVLVVAVLGYSLLPKQGGIGGPQSPTPTLQPSATPVASSQASTAPSASAVFPPWWTSDGPPMGAGFLKAGSQSTRSFTPRFTFSVPEGWVNDSDEAGVYSLFPDTPANEAEFTRSGALAQAIFMGPLSSPYFVCESVEDNRGATAAEMVAAVTANEALATTGLVDVAIGGLTGKQFDVRLNPEWTGTCPPSPGDPEDLGDGRTRAILLDAPGLGVIVIFVGSLHSADFEAFLAEAMPIVDSFQFDLGQ